MNVMKSIFKEIKNIIINQPILKRFNSIILILESFCKFIIFQEKKLYFRYNLSFEYNLTYQEFIKSK